MSDSKKAFGDANPDFLYFKIFKTHVDVALSAIRHAHGAQVTAVKKFHNKPLSPQWAFEVDVTNIKPHEKLSAVQRLKIMVETLHTLGADTTSFYASDFKSLRADKIVPEEDAEYLTLLNKKTPRCLSKGCSIPVAGPHSSVS